MNTPNKENSKTISWVLAHAKYEGDGCLIWPYSKCGGYGHFVYLGKSTYAHRVMCELVNGPPPTAKHQAAHECGNGHLGCVNPRHLSWKTQSENHYDRRRHGTHKTGKGSRTKLSVETVADIRRSKGIEAQHNTAARIGVSRACVRYWQKIDRDPVPPGSHPSTISQRLKKSELLTAD